jgi:hypothetical protein
MVNNYSKTAISITHLKEALVYFDFVIPVNLVGEAVRERWRQRVPAEEFRLEAFLRRGHSKYRMAKHSFALAVREWLTVC